MVDGGGRIILMTRTLFTRRLPGAETQEIVGAEQARSLLDDMVPGVYS